VDFPHKLELALVVRNAIKGGLLRAHVNDAEAPGKVHACGDWFEITACIFENHLSAPKIWLNWF
jgi:hypothetical protein